jgi:hypothetical protein
LAFPKEVEMIQGLRRTMVLVKVGLAGLALAAAASFVYAGDWSLEAQGFEMKGQDPKMMDTIPADTEELVFKYTVKGDSSGQTVSGTWIAEDVGDAAPPETVIDQAAEVKLGSLENEVTFKLSRPTNGWPLGKYRLEVKSGDKIIDTQKFQIVKGE